MYTAEYLKQGVKDKKIEALKGKYIWADWMTTDDINVILSKICLQLNTCEYAPKFILTRALYPNEEGGLLTARFVVRPSVDFVLSAKNVKRTFVIVGATDFFDKFIDNMTEWFLLYRYYSGLSVNAATLNMLVKEISEEKGVGLNFSFALGEGILDLTDNSIVLGLSENVLANLQDSPLFSTNYRWRQHYCDLLANVLRECCRPYDIVKLKNDITKDFGIYQRKSLSRLLRGFVKRRIDYVRTGVGYSEDADRFAVLERLAINPEEVIKYDNKGVIIEDNTDITVKEQKEGRTKIVTYFKVTPFEKTTGIPLDVDIREFLEETREEGV